MCLLTDATTFQQVDIQPSSSSTAWGSLDFIDLVDLISFQKPLVSKSASFVAMACNLILKSFCLHHLSADMKVARDFCRETAISP